MSIFNFKDIKKVTDSKGFVYEVGVIHYPHHGNSYAEYQGSTIADRSYGRMLLPTGDDDGEWEEFQQRFFESIGDSITDGLLYSCKIYFDQRL